MKKCFGIISLAIIAVSFSSCKKLFEDEELSLQRTDYIGTELRTDGYYYWRYQYEHDGFQYDRVEPRFLYRNGVFIFVNRLDFSKLEQQEEDFRKGTFYENIKNEKVQWGIFQISGSSIVFEGWDYSGGPFLTSYKENGEIINDTTFRIKKAIFHFKQFSPKPDSTNRFIK